MTDDLTPPHWGSQEMPTQQMTDEDISALAERLETVGDVPVSAIIDAITTLRECEARLRAQLAEAWAEIARLTDLNSTAYIDGHDAAKNEYRAEIQRLETLNAQLMVMVGEDAVEQIEAAVAAQIEADAGIADEYVAMRERQIAGEKDKASQHVDVPQIMRWQAGKVQSSVIASAIRNQPHSRTALDAAIRAAKVEALRKAEAATLGLATGRECQLSIRAMIEREVSHD